MSEKLIAIHFLYRDTYFEGKLLTNARLKISRTVHGRGPAKSPLASRHNWAHRGKQKKGADLRPAPSSHAYAHDLHSVVAVDHALVHLKGVLVRLLDGLVRLVNG